MKTISPILLASRSPRRRDLLQQMGIAFTVVDPAVDESPLPAEGAESYVRRIALAKARSGSRLPEAGNMPVLGADTAVVLENRILGKPGTRRNATRMLELLSGRTHRVMSGVAIVFRGREWVELQISRVTMKTIDADEIDAYCASGEPFDKAGAYAIQGLGAAFVKHLEGSFSGVMGLPVFETAELLGRISDGAESHELSQLT